MPLLHALKWINGFVGNYGWSIILLTVLINVAMFPLRHSSMVSMRKMQALQPQVKAIQDRYAKLKMTDPAQSEEAGRDHGALQREGASTLRSGCVPMLLTMPILFAFYAMLSRVDRAARPAVRAVDPRPLAARPVLHHAGADGHLDVVAAAADAGAPIPRRRR